MDEILKKYKRGRGGECGRYKKVDLVIVARVRRMKEIMKSLGKYVRKKKLEVNVEKTKMMVFNKKKRKSEEKEWKWEGMKIEQVDVVQWNSRG
jgi:hypothetical protein